MAEPGFNEKTLPASSQLVGFCRTGHQIQDRVKYLINSLLRDQALRTDGDVFGECKRVMYLYNKYMKNKWVLVIVGGLLCIIAWWWTPWFLETKRGLCPEQGAGAYGDQYGFITSLFSVLTTLLVVAGLIFQREEIQSMKEEQKRQRVREALAVWPWLELCIVSGLNYSADEGSFSFILVNHGHLAADFELIGQPEITRIYGIESTQETPSPFRYKRDIAQAEKISFGIKIELVTKAPALEFRFATLSGHAGKVRFLLLNGAVKRTITFPFDVKPV